MILTDFIHALQAGQELADSRTWKNRQATSNAIVAILGLLVTIAGWAGVNVGVTNEDLASIAGGLAVVFGLCNGLVTVATSKKVGL